MVKNAKFSENTGRKSEKAGQVCQQYRIKIQYMIIIIILSHIKAFCFCIPNFPQVVS